MKDIKVIVKNKIKHNLHLSKSLYSIYFVPFFPFLVNSLKTVEYEMNVSV